MIAWPPRRFLYFTCPFLGQVFFLLCGYLFGLSVRYLSRRFINGGGPLNMQRKAKYLISVVKAHNCHGEIPSELINCFIPSNKEYSLVLGYVETCFDLMTYIISSGTCINRYISKMETSLNSILMQKKEKLSIFW